MTCRCDLAKLNPDLDEIEDVFSGVLRRPFRFTERQFWGLLDQMVAQSVGMAMFDGIILTWEATRRGSLVCITA